MSNGDFNDGRRKTVCLARGASIIFFSHMKKASGSNVVERVLRRHSPAVESARHKNARGAATSKMSSSSLLPKLGLGIAVESPRSPPCCARRMAARGRPPRGSRPRVVPRMRPRIRPTPARAGRAARRSPPSPSPDASPSPASSPSPRAPASSPHLIPPRAGALASPPVHSPTASPDLDIRRCLSSPAATPTDPPASGAAWTPPRKPRWRLRR